MTVAIQKSGLDRAYFAEMVRTKLAAVQGFLRGEIDVDDLDLATSREAYLGLIGERLEELERFISIDKLDLEFRQHASSVPDPRSWRDYYNRVIDTIAFLYQSVNYLEKSHDAVLADLRSRFLKVERAIQEIATLIAIYSLYSDSLSNELSIYGDTFNSSSFIEPASKSPLYTDAKQATINQLEGSLTLPVNIENSTIKPFTSITILGGNGTLGRKISKGQILYNDVNAAIDNMPNTWFEYEARRDVGSTNEIFALRFSVLLSLDKPDIINAIWVVPNNLGAQTAPKVIAIDTSVDKESWISVKDGQELPNTIIRDEENVFSLAEDATTGLDMVAVTFLPRYVRYVRVIFEQETPYTIQENGIDRLRWAIGIRNIKAFRLAYESKGTMVSKKYQLQRSSHALILETDQTPSENSSLIGLNHYVSLNDGATWHSLSPAALNPNVNIKTTDEVLIIDPSDLGEDNKFAMRYKAELWRNDSAFSPERRLPLKGEPSTEDISLPGSSLSFKLNKDPVPSSLRILDIDYFGTISRESPSPDKRLKYLYKIGVTRSGEDEQSFPLPFNLKTLSGRGGVYGSVNNEFREVLSFGILTTTGWFTWGKSISGVDPYHFTYDEINKEVTLPSDSTSGLTMEKDENVYLVPFGRQLDLRQRDDGLLEADIPEIIATADARNIDAYFIGRTKTETYTLLAGQTEAHIEIPYVMWFPTPIISIPSYTELQNDKSADFGLPDHGITTDGDFSYSTVVEDDILKVQIYWKTPLAANRVISVNYVQGFKISDIANLEDRDDDLIIDTISVDRTKFGVFINPSKPEFVRATISSDTSLPNKIELSSAHIVKGTLSVAEDMDGYGLFVKEVPYIDGSQEFTQHRKIVEDVGTIYQESSTLYYFDLSVTPDDDVTLENAEIISLDNKQATKAAVSADGDYFIDTTYRRLYFYADSTASSVYTTPVLQQSFMNARVYYEHTLQSFDPAGLYSVDYIKGIVYFSQKGKKNDPVAGTTVSTTISYMAGSFLVNYPMAYRVQDHEFTYDETSRTVTILGDSPYALARRSITRTEPSHIKVIYRAIDQSAPTLAEIARYISPKLYAYTIKVAPSYMVEAA